MGEVAQIIGRTGPGVASALRFLAATRADLALRDRLAGLFPEQGLDPVRKLAAEAGFNFTDDDLRAAFAHDWAFRRARYLQAGPAPHSAASTVAVVNSPSSST